MAVSKVEISYSTVTSNCILGLMEVWGFQPKNITFSTVWQCCLGIAKPKMFSDQP